MKLTRAKQIQLSLLTLFIISVAIVSYTDHYIQTLIQEKRFLVPTQYYASPTKFYLGQVQNINKLSDYFDSKNYRKREFGAPIKPGDFSIGNREQCSNLSQEQMSIFACLFFRPTQTKKLALINFNELDQITGIYTGEDLRPSLFAEAEAEAFAQYLGSKPTQQQKVSLGEIPRYCLDAVIAIEDPDFLAHQGISLRGIFRALVTNVRQVRWSQGGSTITQQLVKNYFLNPEKKIIRKIKEIFMSLIFELRVSKDDILETYLNIIYLGQSGVFEVRGYSSAAEFYFQKPIDQLDLNQCALLAAIVNSPGRYHPVRHPERAKKRKERVLTKMLEQNMINQTEFEQANQGALPSKVQARLSDSAPYYVDAVNKKLVELGFTDRSGLNVYTALDPKAQVLAEKAVKQSIASFEKHRKQIKQLKEEKKLNLQAALLSSNPLTGEVTAIVGGRDFTTSPFNRAVESQRQVGSVFKPIVYLAALRKTDPNGIGYSPLSKINNSPYKLEYDRQTWEPKNYDKSFSGPLPMFYTLKESVNVPTARLAMEVGLDNVIQTARDLGITSKLKEYPSISLGAFELNPLEVLEAYNTLSQMGQKRPLVIVKSVSNQRDEILYETESKEELAGDPADYAVLIGMLKQTLISGTGQFTRKMGFNHVAAGKTGTTSDTKDAWFAGFTPFQTAVVWVGFDEAVPHGLTGASGALPIWTRYMRELAKSYSNRDFDFPDSVYRETLDSEQLIDFGIKEEKAIPTVLIFKNTAQ